MKKRVTYLAIFAGLIIIVGSLATLKITQFRVMGQTTREMPPETVTSIIQTAAPGADQAAVDAATLIVSASNAAIANAVATLTGKRMRKLPMTADALKATA